MADVSAYSAYLRQPWLTLYLMEKLRSFIFGSIVFESRVITSEHAEIDWIHLLACGLSPLLHGAAARTMLSASSLGQLSIVGH